MESELSFKGFTMEASQFMLELKFNNDRSWFKPRKDQFDQIVY